MSADIKLEIVARRRERVAKEGWSFGHEVPRERQVPLVPFERPPFVICEVKRKSPSKGTIAGGLDAVEQARRYVEAGVKTISVLTEEDFFGGSLADLMAAKRAFPQTAFLRKDFLVSKEDIDVAFRAGADAILLIASILSSSELADLKAYAESLGLAVFLEVHSQDDCAKAAPLRPRFTGINCRNLGDFSLDRALPLKVRPLITWPTRLVFESGIFRPEEALWARSSGFQGVLVGEGAVKLELAGQLVQALSNPADGELSFWARLYERQRPGRPLVKVCGLTTHDDALFAERQGADLLGFIFAETSKRRVTSSFVRNLPATKALKVGVVQLSRGSSVPADLVAMVEEGLLDALQFHGDEDPVLLDAWVDRGYKVLSLTGPASWQAWTGMVAPRILVDTGSGGSGKPLDDEVLTAFSSSPWGGNRLWLAGGLTPENIADKITRWRPELVDASSGLEAGPGRKDPAKVERFFSEINRVSPQE